MKPYRLPPRRLFNWLRRFRKRCGYGIHSPHAFQLVTGVIYESDSYYAYKEWPETAKNLSLREKDQKLLFRLANFSEAETALALGAEAETVMALFKKARPRLTHSETPDLLYVGKDSLENFRMEDLLPHFHDKTLYILQGIHANSKNRAVWQRLIEDERVRQSFDLYDFGIACFEQRLVKEDYTINYF